VGLQAGTQEPEQLQIQATHQEPTTAAPEPTVAALTVVEELISAAAAAATSAVEILASSHF
jgi:hypothetical protein